MMAFKDHGEVKLTIENELDQARSLIQKLAEVGIEMHQVTDQLENEGVKKFSDSFVDVLAETAKKRDRFLKKESSSPLSDSLEAPLPRRGEGENLARGLAWLGDERG